MTRINIVVPPVKLIDQHLLAEYRELPRVFNLANNTSDIPERFVLGKGHVKFFYNKLSCLKSRWNAIVIELDKRAFNLNDDYIELVNYNYISCSTGLKKDYVPTIEDIYIIKNRIKERIKDMKSPRYYGEPVDIIKAIKLLT